MQPLPQATTTQGRARRTGVEVEFAGLSEAEVGEIAIRDLGGSITEQGQLSVTIADCALGTLRIELDTALRQYTDNALIEAALDWSRDIVPVEIITEPLAGGGLNRLERFCHRLREAGAVGSRAGILLGFGVHFNPEITGPEDPFTFATIKAYGLLEAHLRRRQALDTTRRLLPFVDPWPAGLVSALVAEDPQTMPALTSLYLDHIASRNCGLDLLPMLRHFNPEAVEGQMGGKVSARPAFHFRLPESRIDEAGWSLNQGWALWGLVEQVAQHPPLLAGLSAAWAERWAWPFTEGQWADHCARLLQEAGLEAQP